MPGKAGLAMAKSLATIVCKMNVCSTRSCSCAFALARNLENLLAMLTVLMTSCVDPPGCCRSAAHAWWLLVLIVPPDNRVGAAPWAPRPAVHAGLNSPRACTAALPVATHILASAPTTAAVRTAALEVKQTVLRARSRSRHAAGVLQSRSGSLCAKPCPALHAAPIQRCHASTPSHPFSVFKMAPTSSHPPS
eukprot:364955-Chlamydomonas_euryale.AAC.36